jgi:2-polyprenyl-6-methoxyphenol hydroxylase-like FAD-dependent oxidoreductase
MHRQFTICILGAGVAGLATSIALAHQGHRVELVDERFDVPAVGTSLGLFPSAHQALARLGVLEAVRDVAAAPRAGAIHGADGRIIAPIPAVDALLVTRSDLVRILQENLPASVQITRRRVTDVRPLRKSADLLIGADGVHSLVRRSGWGPRSHARRHRATVLRGTADIAPPEVSETWGGGWLFGMTPLSARRAEPADAPDAPDADGARGAAHRTNWFACVPEHRTSSTQEDLDHLRELVGGHREPIDTVLAAARPENTLVHGIHSAPLVHPVRDNVVLIGDAAHAMTPNLGHGANTSLVDAVSLSEAVRAASSSPSITGSSARAALRSYALRRSLPDQGWRVASHAVLRMAMMDANADRRDRLLRTVVGGRIDVVGAVEM